ncbi:ubiquitin carboxyl-terminal hydrolase-domain-containing protein [Auriculariales sp. MPI-PUGE-AT-0066]|nr:ubiquitin carboxyl-terminal hydrolase-domain-containing protein [Auriculariales sp. MPI-PUGE-AT-0066]
MAYRVTTPISITALAFDPVSDTLWTGTQSGQVAAFHSARERSVYFTAGGPVQKIYATDSQVRAMGQNAGVGGWSKGGMTKYYWRPTDNTQVLTFCPASSSATTLIAATTAPEFVVLNASTGQVMRSVSSPAHLVTLAPSPSAVISGSSDGQIRVHDIRASSTVASVKAHVGGVQSVLASGSYAFSIGWAIRQGRPHADPLVKVFDVRNLRPVASIPFPSGPTFMAVHPVRPTTIVASSANGLVNIFDATNPSGSTEFLQLDVTSYISSIAISPTGGYIAFGDSDGTVRIATAYETPEEEGPFNGFEGMAPEWFTEPEPLPQMDWDERTPLNTIGMPFYNDTLLSSWATDFLPSTDLQWPPPPKIPTQVLAEISLRHGIMSANLPRELRGKRNLAPTPAKTSSKGRFMSDRGRRTDVVPDTPTEILTSNDVPRAYHKVEIEYSKFGVEDFDFAYYNKTSHSGLETHIQNCYTNSLIQAFHYMLPLRRLAKSHITTDCAREHCMLCEFGFVTRMLEDAKGKNCHISNFCNTFSAMPTASAMGVVDYYDTDAAKVQGRRSDYAIMIQQFNRFWTEAMVTEGSDPLDNNISIIHDSAGNDYTQRVESPLSQLMGLHSMTAIKCTTCRATSRKHSLAHTVDLFYPPNWKESGDIDFAALLRMALVREREFWMNCPSCRQLSHMRSSRVELRKANLPPLLSVNACAFNDSDIWVDNRGSAPMLQPRVSLQLDDGIVEFEVRSLVIKIVRKEELSSPHLVSIVKIPEQEGRDEGGWFLFNDFVVKSITEDEALRFPGKWKIPCVICLERIDMQDRVDFTKMPISLDPSILTRDLTISLKRDKSRVRHEPLGLGELPTPGMVVAIDAEFVQLQQAEIEVRSDGTKKTLRPPRQSLARVSVLRGDGPKEGIPFIDDHIHTAAVVVNYLTEYSGIHQGDLDPATSRHTLVPRKVAYKKLRLLVDMGCMFVGHGLMNDFRTINIHVPADQVLDTIDIYFVKHRSRRFNLRFLTWFVLKEDIQTANHDSIEDAKAALLLYKKWQESEEGTFSRLLESLYKDGKEHNYRAPGAPQIASPVPAPAAPATPVPSPVLHRQGRSSRDHSSDARQVTFSPLSPLGATHFTGSPFSPTGHPFVSPRQAALAPHGNAAPFSTLPFDMVQALRQVQLGVQATPSPQASAQEWTEYWYRQQQDALRRMGGGPR